MGAGAASSAPSDRVGGYPSLHPVGPWDIAATLFAALGIDPAVAVADAAGRTFPATIGEPIAGLYG